MKLKHESVLQQAELGNFPAAKPEPQPKPKSNTGWIAGGVLLAVMLLGGLGMLALMFVSVDVAVAPRMETVTTVNAVSEAPRAVVPGSIKRWAEDLPFDADQYPSVAACARPIAKQIVEQVQLINAAAITAEASDEETKVLPTESTAIAVSHNGFTDNDYHDFIAALEEALQSLKPNVFLADSAMNNTHSISFHLKNIKRFEDAFPDLSLIHI